MPKIETCHVDKIYLISFDIGGEIMAGFMVGEMIRRLRMQRGITQEFLAYPYLERGHLSKIERGKTMPNKRTIEILLERLGHNPKSFTVFYMDQKTAEIQSIMDELEGYLKRRKIREADALIARLEEDVEFTSNDLYRQYLLSAKASSAISKKEDSDKIFDILRNAIMIGIPLFKEDDIEKYLLTKIDIELINMMAVVYCEDGHLEKSINLMYRLKENFDSRFVDNVSKGIHYPLVIYNLTKYLGMSERYKEAIKLCDAGKEVCLDISALRILPLIIMNKAACLYELGDKKDCEKLLRQAYYASEMHERFDTTEEIKNYAEEKLGITFL